MIMRKKIAEYGLAVSKNNNYERADILQLMSDYGKRAFLLTCRFVPNNSDKYYTFGNVRVFDEAEMGKTKYQLTDHINFPRAIVNYYAYIDESEMRRKKFFAVCVPEIYMHYGRERAGLKLVKVDGGCPIVRAPEKTWEWESTLEELVRLRDQYNSKL